MKSLLAVIIITNFFLIQKGTAQNNVAEFDSEWALKCAEKEHVPAEKLAEFLGMLKASYNSAKWAKQHENEITYKLPDHPPTPFSSYCPNLGFENIDFSGWQGYTTLSTSYWPVPPAVITTWTNGISSTGINAPLKPGFIIGTGVTPRHTIMTIPPGNNNPSSGPVVGYDSLAINPTTGLADIPYLPLGANGSVLRLGNAQVGSQAEKVSYKLTVTAQNPQITIRYAVVLNDGGHPAGQQPFFQMITKDATDATIPGCGVYTVDASNANSDPTFIKISSGFSGDIYYKKWTTVGLDLTPYIGQTITIEFVTADCTNGGHFGYAYVDVSCSIVELNLNFCNGSNTAMIIGPESGYIGYQWYGPNSTTTAIPGATNDTLIVNNPVVGDAYYLTCLSANGCTSKMKINLYHTSVKITSSTSTPTCAGASTGSAHVDVTGSAGAYQFVWTNAAGVAVGGNSAAVSNLPIGTYSVSVSSPGCGSTDTTVTIAASPPSFNSTTVDYCGNAKFLVAPAGTNYIWYNAQGAVTPSPLGDSLFVTNLADGLYFTVVYNTTIGCSDSLKMTLHDISTGSLNVTNIINVCKGSTNGAANVNLVTSNAGPFFWTVVGSNAYTYSTSNSNAILSLTGLSVGSYSVNVVDGLCTYSSFFKIQEISVPVDVTVNPTHLNGCDTAHVTFNFGLGGIPSACQLITSACSFPSIITVGTGSFQNTPNGYPSPYGNSYSNEKYQIIYTVSELLNAGLSPGKISSIAFDVLSIPSGMNTKFKNYSIKMACIQNASFNQVPSTFYSPTFSNVFGPQDIYVTTGLNTHNFPKPYLWDGTSNILVEICYDYETISSSTANAIVRSEGTLNYSFAVYRNNTMPVCNGTSIDQVCKSRPVTKFGNCLSNAQASDFNYTWSPGTGVLLPTSPDNSNNVVNLFPLQTQFYQLTTTTVVGNCPRVDTFTIYVAKPFKVKVFKDTALCMDRPPIQVKGYAYEPISSSTLNIPGVWTGTSITNQPNGIGVFNPSIAGAGTFKLIYTASGPCTKVKDSVNIIVHPLPSPNFYSNPETLSTIDENYHANFINISNTQGATLWQWDIAGFGSASTKDTQYDFPTWGTYNITLTATNEFGCTANITHPFVIEPDFVFYIPNAFTPNSDGKNDTFQPKSTGVINEGYTMYIYDRWGEKLFETSDLNTGWNGQINNTGEKAESEVYVYVVKFKSLLNKTYQKKGTVSLIR